MRKTYPAGIACLVLLITLITCSKSSDPDPVPASLSSVEPTSGIIGDPVLIKGTNLLDAERVTFGNVESIVLSASATSLATVVPNGVTAGVKKITIHSSAGKSNEIDFEVLAIPVNYDSAPPTIAKIIPSSTFSDYPILIYGDNLSGALKVTINDKDAKVFTNNKKVVTITVPADLPAGSATIKVRTMKGTTTYNFTTQGAPPTAAGMNFSIVTIPPPNYVVAISNFWTCGFFEDKNDGTFIDPNNPNITGRYEFEYDVAKNYNRLNYIEWINTVTKDTTAAMFSSQYEIPCVYKMVTISSKTKKVDTCTVDNSFDPECQ
jgi:hypothetical protein